jgi:hypothetical protein
MTAIGRITQRFRLIARARPACRPLDERVQEVAELARAAAQTSGVDALSLAATAHNKAALIASDAGLPGLARTLCWRHADTYLRAQPLDTRAARYALEPIVNLGRLLIRDGDGDGAYRLLDSLYHAVRFRKDAVIDGRQLSFRSLTNSDDALRAVCQWLWTVLVADGTRALASAGRWRQAVAHAERHNGVGRRLLDGRQVAVLDRCLAGDPGTALTLIEDTTPTESWERAVAACLTVLCLTSAAQAVDEAVAAMVDHYLGLDLAPELQVFSTRLGLTVLDLAGEVAYPEATKAAAQLVTAAVASGDGYVARDILGNDRCKVLVGEPEKRTLSATVQSSGLGCGTTRSHEMADLRESARMSETAIARVLN